MGNLFAKNFSNLSLKPINEVAEELEIEPYILRFWETKFNQIKPTKGRGNRRLYNNKDIALIKSIKDLLYNKGFTIEGAKKFLNGDIALKQVANSNNKESSTIISDTIKELKVLKAELQELI
ncbi:MAG: MerR family transcriptional regulator [Rickettsiales bacterium]